SIVVIEGPSGSVSLPRTPGAATFASSGVLLNVAALGVLGNDTDPDGPSMTVVLVSGPAHAASFALNANGSFSYQSTSGFSDTDTFTYKVSDGSLFSNIATVTITVTNQP